MADGDKPKSRHTRYWFMVVGLLALGYLSAWVSGRQCQRSTALWLQETVPHGEQFVIPREYATHEYLKIWNSLRANYRVQDPPKEGWAARIPWCSFGLARPRFPFITAVDYGWVAEPQVGDGGRMWYFCLFGFTFNLGRTYDWMT